MTITNRRTLLAGIAGAMTLSLAGVPSAWSATPTIAMVQINQQALFFNPMLQGAQAAVSMRC